MASREQRFEADKQFAYRVLQDARQYNTDTDRLGTKAEAIYKRLARARGMIQPWSTDGTAAQVKCAVEYLREMTSLASDKIGPASRRELPGQSSGSGSDWWSAGQRWLEQEALRESASQKRAWVKSGRSAKTFRYDPPSWHREAVEALGRNDEEGFKAIKLGQIGLPPLSSTQSRAYRPTTSVQLTSARRPSRREIEHDVETISEDGGADDRLFVGVRPTGIRYADKRRERDGDYLPLAFLPYDTLEIEWEPGVPVALGLREAIQRDARLMQARRGERFSLSSSDNASVILGRK